MRSKVHAKLCGQYFGARGRSEPATAEFTCEQRLLAAAKNDAMDAALLVNEYTACGFADEGEGFLRAYISMASDIQSLIIFAKIDFNYSERFIEHYYSEKLSNNNRYCSEKTRIGIEESFENDWYIENIGGRVEFVEDLFIDDLEIWIDDDGIVRQECP